MHPWIAKNVVYRALQEMRREPVLAKLGELKQSEFLSRESLADMQLKKLKTMLAYAEKNVPYYRKLFREARFSAASFKRPEDLNKIPVLTKELVTRNYTSLKAGGSYGPLTREYTSGSSGNPMVFLTDRNFSAYFRASLYREHQWAGLDIGEKEVRFYGHPLNTLGRFREWVKDKLMNRIRVSVFDFSERALQKHYRRILSFRPHYLYGYATAIAQFSRWLQARGTAPDVRLKAIISTSEILSPEDKSLMESVWHCPVYNEYGCSECGIIAGQCEEGSLHINVENLYVEVLKGDAPAGEGEPGSVVVTNLNNFAMPLIRYRLGDMAVLSDNYCLCGREHPLIREITGRENEMVRTPENKIVSGWFFYYLFRNMFPEGQSAPKFRAIQKSLDHIHIQYEKNGESLETVKSDLLNRCRSQLGTAMNITLEAVTQIPPAPSGKKTHFISEL